MSAPSSEGFWLRAGCLRISLDRDLSGPRSGVNAPLIAASRTGGRLGVAGRTALVRWPPERQRRCMMQTRLAWSPGRWQAGTFGVGAPAAPMSARVLVAACTGSTPPGPSAAPASPSVDLSAELRARAGRLLDQGATGAVIRVDDGHRVVQFAVGLADLKPRRDLEPGDEFRVGSTTKTFMAALVLQLVAERTSGSGRHGGPVAARPGAQRLGRSPFACCWTIPAACPTTPTTPC